MSKIKTTYNCTNCAYQTIKWLGCCPECKSWNTLELSQAPSGGQKTLVAPVTLTALSGIETKPFTRMLSGIKEWDRVTGGGLVPGEFAVVTGDPGIGKSTLLLQIADKLARSYTIFYFSSEESLEQVKLRADRLGITSPQLLFADQANLDQIISTAQAHKPHVVIIDSIQNCYTQDAHSIPGSIGQLKESAFKLMRLAKEHDITVIVTGHITKDGVIAGPKTLEHMVDAVFYLQGEDRWQTRVLRSVKNRFGTIHELGFFEMVEEGMQEVPNINQQLLEEISYSPGSVLISFIEGSRPLLLELQALVLSSKFGMPQRVVSGIDQTQVVLIAAILEKYLQVKLSAHDIFFKVSGGFKIKTSGADLGIALALLSSYFQKPLPEKSLALGEISLTGQIKPINHIGIHASEAEKFGISKLLLAHNQKIETSCKTMRFTNVYELLSLFGD
ncbi:DNA repair protein RadA [Candidatus Dependentiae bacterium]|nr:DNA repair protein RadA [Candidatus Dependentiae bacterium]